MKKRLVVCGDSFNYGIGCVDMATGPYCVHVAKKFNWDLIRLARGSASNYIIYLQGMYAADMAEKPHLIILGETSYDRVEWLAEGASENQPGHTALNINYHQYPPHCDTDTGFYFNNNPDYRPIILSEQVSGIDHCLETRKQLSNHYSRLNTEPSDKLKMILDHYIGITDRTIKANYDIGLILQAYTYIKNKGINVIVLTRHMSAYEKFISKKDLMFQDWYHLSNLYPDTIGSLHTGEHGHIDTAERLIHKIGESGYD